MIDLKYVGNRIRTLRLEKGFTQSEFADLLCVSFQAVSNWERGIASPDLDNLVRISELFGTTLDELIRSRGEDLFLGIDGGGTKTEFAVSSSCGNVLMHTAKSGCNPNDIGYERMFSLLREEIDRIISDYQTIKSMYLGIAGITAGKHAERLYSDLKKCYPKTKIQIQSDTFNLFAMCDDASMAIVSGTGSVAFADDGESYSRIGGWGYLFDDAGSGFGIGRDGIKAALDEEDQKLPPSEITALLRKRFNTHTVWEHISTIYKEGKPYIAGLSEVVFEAYKKADPKAVEIIDNNAKALANLLNTGMKLYGASGKTIASGGIFTHHSETMLSHIAKYTNAQLIISELPPVCGACKRACQNYGIEVGEDFYESFKKTYGEIDK